MQTSPNPQMETLGSTMGERNKLFPEDFQSPVKMIS